MCWGHECQSAYVEQGHTNYQLQAIAKCRVAERTAFPVSSSTRHGNPGISHPATVALTMSAASVGRDAGSGPIVTSCPREARATSLNETA